MSSPCPCRGCKAAFEVGYKEGAAEGCKTSYADGYRQGYNDHARSRAYAEAVYGPYKPVVLRENERVINGDVFQIGNQHGKGENP